MNFDVSSKDTISMSKDTEMRTNMSKDYKMNGTPTETKSKDVLPSLEETVKRLQRVSGEKRMIRIMRWLGVSDTTFANWRRRNTVNHVVIMEALLKRGISLDWFYAEEQDLLYPMGPSRDQLAEYAERYKTGMVEETIKALKFVEPLFKKYQVPDTEENRQILVETYLARRENYITLSFGLQQVAKALAHGYRAANAPSEDDY